jgi:hypothetical protein
MSMGTELAGMLYLIATYGKSYLTSQETSACVKRHISAYYRFLGKKWLCGRGRAFWDLHRRQMAEAGVCLKWTPVILGALTEMAHSVIMPKKAIRALMKERGWQSLAPSKPGVRPS